VRLHLLNINGNLNLVSEWKTPKGWIIRMDADENGKNKENIV